MLHVNGQPIGPGSKLPGSSQIIPIDNIKFNGRLTSSGALYQEIGLIPTGRRAKIVHLRALSAGKAVVSLRQGNLGDDANTVEVFTGVSVNESSDGAAIPNGIIIPSDVGDGTKKLWVKIEGGTLATPIVVSLTVLYRWEV